MNNTILIKNALILSPNNFEEKRQSLLIKDDLIAEISDEIDESKASKIIDADGKISYTRNGSFIVNRDEYLVTKQGEYVLDVNNRRVRMIPDNWDPTVMRDRIEIVIGEQGNIEMNSYNQKIPMQTIGVFDFSNKEDLFEIGDCKFVPMDKENNPELRAEKFTVQQGMLELSNSSVIKEMINTIQTSRNYESLTKVVTTNNDLLRTAVSVGRISRS